MPKIATPTNSDELQEVLNDERVMEQVMESPDSLKEFIENYKNASLESDPSILAQAREQTERVMIEYIREHELDNTRRLNLDPHSRISQPSQTVYNKDALGASHDKSFTNLTEMFYSVSNHAYKDANLSKKLGSLKNDLSSVKPSDGGFLIPEDLRAELLQVALETAIVRSRATVIPMDSLKVPIPSVDSTSNVSSVFGGITGFWTEEGATLGESQPKFGRVNLEAHKLTLYTEVPNELIADARPSLAAFLGTKLPQALAWFEDVAFFVGGGVGEPLGFLNAPAMVQVTRNAAGNAVEWIDVVNMYSRMLPQSLGSAVWVVSPDVFPNLATMTVGNVPVWLGNSPSGGGAASPWGTMLGRPMIVSEKARALATAGDINFVDFGYYLVGDRQAMSVRQSEDFRFQNDLTAFRVIERVDGRPWLQSAITPQNGSANTLSAFIQLTT